MSNVGGITYYVNMDVAPLLSAQRRVDQRLAELENRFDHTTRAVRETEQSMFSFSKVAGLVASALSIGAIINAVDEWGQMAARIKMAINSVEGDISRYEELQERFLQISNRNGKAIEDTQLLYVGAATSMQELGYNTTQTIDYIESLSSSLTANATSANETQSMINALNKSMVSGKVAGDNWNSIMNATPTILSDLAKELSRTRGGMKVTESEVKQLAAQGKISFQLFADTVIKAKDANNEMANSMENTVADGFTKLTNSAKAYYGELNQSLGITSTISAGFATLTENMGALNTVVIAAASVLVGRFANSLVIAGMAQAKKTKDTISGMIATRQAAAMDVQAANVLVRKANADKGAALSALNLAKAEYEVAKGSAAEATALANVTRLKTLYSEAAIVAAQSNNVLLASQARLATMGLTLANVWKSLQLVLAPLGGLVGAATLAAGAVYYFWSQAEEAKKKTREFTDELPSLIEKLNELNAVQLRAASLKTRENIQQLTEDYKAQSKEAEVLRDKIAKLNESIKNIPNGEKTPYFLQNMPKYIKDLTLLEEDRYLTSTKLSFAQDTLVKVENQLTQKFKEQMQEARRLSDELDRAEKRVTILSNAQDFLAGKISLATGEMKKFNAESLKKNWGGDDGEKLAKATERRLELSKREGEARAKLQAQYDAEDAGITDPNRIKELAENYALIDQNNTSKKEGNKIDVKSAKSADSITEALKRQQEAVTRLQKGYKDNSLEMAKYDAVAALGGQASAPQIERAEKLAADKFAIEQRLADKRAAIEANALAKAQEQRINDLTLLERQLDAGSVTFEQAQKRRAAIAGEYSRKIAEESAKGAVNYIEENRVQVDPVQSLKNQNAQKLALMETYQKQEQAILNESYGAGNLSYSNFIATKQSIDAQYLALRTAQETQFQEQQTAAQMNIWRNQGLANEALAATFDSLAGNASNTLTGIATQSMDASDALRSIGSNALNSLINSFVQMGVTQAKSAWFGAGQQQAAIATTTAVQTTAIGTQTAVSTAAAATTTAAWTPAAIMASIASMGTAAKIGMAAVAVLGIGAIAGKRKNGGPVDAGSMYRVGEGGKPEIFKASNGNQYMIPGDNGKVISNKDMQGGGKELNVSVVFNDYSSGRHQFEAQASQSGDTLTVQAFLTDMQEKGPMHRSITQSTSATTRL